MQPHELKAAFHDLVKTLPDNELPKAGTAAKPIVIDALVV
jgi:hypothetical protein